MRVVGAPDRGMALLNDVTTASVGTPRIAVPERWRVRTRLSNPAIIFALVSLLFGAVVLVCTPPLRGPDEAAHFLRAFGIAQGDIVPSLADEAGRKGVRLPARLHRDFDFFEASRYTTRTPGFTYRQIFAAHAQRNSDPMAADEDGPVFVLYSGSEGYSPIPYLPYVAAILLARAVDLDFLGMLYLMRLFGLVAMTAVAAYAIAVVPRLKWPFLVIALLPSALYSRAVLSADGAGLAYAMAMVALALRATLAAAADRPWQHSLWMALSALSKPPQLAFILLEAMKRPLRDLPRHWASAAIVVLPGAMLSLLWAVAGSTDVAAYRLTEGMGLPAEHFDPVWKLRFMLAEPLLFPRLMANTFTDYGVQLWRQLIGVLGWLDTPLTGWVYPVLSALLLASCLASLELDRATGRRVALVCMLGVLGYCFAVFLIFFLVWTALDATQVDGVQGRYFVAALPVLAVVPAALLRRGLAARSRTVIGLAAAAISCAATIEAILRVDWNWR